METKGYRFYDHTSTKLLISHDVVFDEKSTWDLNKVQLSPSSVQRVDDLIHEPTIEEAHDDHGNLDFSLEPASFDSSSPCTTSS